MDRYRFDSLTKAMASGTSRRTLLKGLLGGAALGTGVTLVPESVGAQDDICIEPGGECVMEDGATPCCGSYTCFEAMCDNAKGCWEVEDDCDAEYPCCDESMVCVDGTCVTETDTGGGEVDVLPATGAGPEASGSTWAGAAAVGGAAAAAALLLRKGNQAEESAN
jgi:hypothetical protein